NHVDALNRKKNTLEQYKQEIWGAEWVIVQDLDPDNSRWNQGNRGLFSFAAQGQWKLDVDRENQMFVLDPKDGILAKMTAGNMDADINYAIRNVWIKDFYEPEVKEVEDLLYPAYF